MSSMKSSDGIVDAPVASRIVLPISIHFEDLRCTVTELKFGLWPSGKSFLVILLLGLSYTT